MTNTKSNAKLDEIIERVTPDAIATRHFLHANPELSHKEEKTSALVADKLRALDMDDVQTGVGGFGVVATLHGTAGEGPGFAIRADMDALPIQEEADRAYQSCVPGVMHACGHDGHTATLLGTAQVLSQMRENLRGSVKFLFQPAEETVGGAVNMVADGALNGVDAIIALHGWPNLEVGQIGVRPGPMMASADTFDIIVRGRGGHAAYPHVTVDPIAIAAQIVGALQTIASREINPADSIVVTVAQFHAGTAYNIIPDTATLKGTVRCLSNAVRAEMPERLERIASGLCAAHRATCEVTYRHGTPVTVNDAAVNQLIADVGADVLGASNVIPLAVPSMGAEDFGVYCLHVPGAMFRLGVGTDVSPLHTPTYNFTDAAVPVGMRMFAHAALTYLGR